MTETKSTSMNTESYLKSNIACNIISLLLKECGYAVIPLRSNELLDRLASATVKKTKISKILFNIPQLIIINKEEKLVLLSVKYKGQSKSGRNIDWGYKQIDEYWPGSLMIIVTNQEPFFLVANGEAFIGLNESAFKINKKTSDKYAHLIQKFFQD